jgi:XTP/dITP diphosphohydrolase
MSGPRDTLVVATGNRGKLDELRALLADLPLRVLGVSEVLRDPPRVVEDGETFEANAVKKAREVAAATTMLTLADDSGLEVDALGGRPGVRSARFAHERATDAENNAALLAALAAVPDGVGAAGDGFPARFRCVLALVDPFTASGAPRTVEGVCEGTVIRAPRGSGGFGYDPLFVVAGAGRTMAELAEAEKNRLSHRGRAFAALRPALEHILRERAAQVARLG